MFCRQCGKQIADDAKFCANCGWKISGNAAPATKPETVAVPATGAATPAAQPKTTTVQVPEKKKKGALWGVIIGLLILLAGCVVVVVCLMGKLNEEDDKKDKKKDRVEEVVEDAGESEDEEDEEEMSVGRAEAVVDPLEYKRMDIASVGSIMDAIEIVAIDPAINWYFLDGPIRVEFSESGCLYYGGDVWAEAINQLDRIIPADGVSIQGDWEYSLNFSAYKMQDGQVYFVRDVEDLGDIEAVSMDLSYRFTSWEEVASMYASAEDSLGTSDSGSESGGDTPMQESQPYTVITDAYGNLIDLGGMEIVIRDWWSTGEITCDSAYEEARIEYLEWAQETYNFTIKEVGMSSWNDVLTDYRDYVVYGGSDENYVFCLRPGTELAQMINEGLMYDVSTLDCLDFTEAKWSSNVHNKYSGNYNEIYAFRGVTPERYSGMYFNKRLLEEAGISPDDIYMWQRDGSWTWDKFADICARVQCDYDNDGIVDVWGMSTNQSDFYKYAVYSNNGHFVNKVNGQYVYDVESFNTVEALNWADEMIRYYQYPGLEGDNWDYFLNGFADGRACFCADSSYRAEGEFAWMNDDYGFVCFPMGPESYDYVNPIDENVYVIPACYDSERAWKIAFVYNLYTEPIPGYENEEEWKNSFYYKFRDAESVDYTLELLSRNGYITYHDLIPGIDLAADFLWKLGAYETPVQVAEQIRNAWNGYIDSANY